MSENPLFEKREVPRIRNFRRSRIAIDAAEQL